jgi:hypothetical protein
MLKKIIATAVLGGTLALGAAGVAGAATTSGTTHPNCAKAQAAVTRIVKLEAKANVWLPKAQQREATASQNGNTKRADRIERRIARVQKLEAKAAPRIQKLEAACPGTTTPSGTAAS